MARHVGARDGLASERNYTLRTLPQGVLRGLIDALFHRDLAGLVRAGTIVVGLAITTLGYLVGSTSLQKVKSKKIIGSMPRPAYGQRKSVQ